MGAYPAARRCLAERGTARSISSSQSNCGDAKLEAMLIYSMGVSVDGFIADREGAFGWTVPDEE
ncbi:MAG TPA: hypothetical protein VGG87_12340, partial [Solirubrobacteraceae bacterium]